MKASKPEKQHSAIQRAELEQAKSREEMQAIIDLFCDRNIFPDEAVHLRQGICKVMLEEYIPLWTLLELFSGAKGRLTSESNNGPDALIVSTDGQETTVQIVTAYTDHQDALGREMLSKKRISFASSPRSRNPKTRDVEESKSGALSSPEGRTAKVVKGIQRALHKKIANYKLGTDVLLICGESSLSPIMRYYTWREDTLAMLSNTQGVPYKRICICDGNRVHLDYCPA